MKSRRPIVLALAALALVGYLGYRWWRQRQPYEWSGTVEARTIDIGSRVGGRVKDVLAKEGERVKAGQPLVQLEAGDLEAQRLQAKAQLDQAQATLSKLERGARPEEILEAKARADTARAALEQTKTGARQEEIDAARARLQAAEVAVQKAQLDEDRATQLYARGAATKVDKDNADIALRTALANRDTLKHQLDELEHGSRREELAQAHARAMEAQASAKLVAEGSRIEDIQAARAAVEAAQGRLDQMNVMIDELTIRAPRPARIEALDLRPGDILAPNATAATLVEDDQLYVRIYVPETLLGHIHPGQEVPITVDSFPDKAFKGVVEHINTVGEYSPRNLQTADERADQVFATRVGIREGGDVLRAGMAAFIQVPHS